MSSTAIKRRRVSKWILGGVALVVLIFSIDYHAYAKVSSIGGRSFNKGENGIWLRHTWYDQPHSDRSVAALAGRLRARQITNIYVHVRSVDENGDLIHRHPNLARSFVRRLRSEMPEARVFAWIFGGNSYVRLNLDWSKPVVRRRLVETARWLIKECDFDGIQWDLEIIPNHDNGFIQVLRETRSALPGIPISLAVPLWRSSWIPVNRLGWSSDYFALVARECDQMAVTCYDSGMYFPRWYVWLVRQQAIRLSAWRSRGLERDFLVPWLNQRF